MLISRESNNRRPKPHKEIEPPIISSELKFLTSYRSRKKGRFLSSQSPAVNAVTRSKRHGLVACHGEDSAVECFDMRVRFLVGRINVVAPAGDIDQKKMLSFRFQLVIRNALTMPTDLQKVTAVEFDGEGCNLMAVGSSAGKVLIYDLRSSQSQPMRAKDHM
ncbi:hypothetical protein RHGRI_010834 [Rhododendron griersonianum]|uniref:Nucleolar protein 10-like N-terminal domain-containing protein n=1 Tax=Rhododendron griersonianum TaxID=479676 RepID=A0AAV6KKI0_9ERIC|nr:hypothetical protein RHGRI_010834 [Rhododendron griersonianum]